MLFGAERQFLYNADAISLLDSFKLAKKIRRAVDALFEINKIYDENEFESLLNTIEKVIKTSLQLVEESKTENLRKAAQKAMRTLPDLFHYFDIAKGIVKDRQTLVDNETLKADCTAWQWGKVVRKSKTNLCQAGSDSSKLSISGMHQFNH